MQSYIDVAISNNPEIQKFDFQYKIALEKIEEVNSLPNTEFSAGVMALAPKMEMPMERFKISAMQMLPWFGTLSSRKDYAASMAESEYAEVNIAKRKLARSISQLYYLLYEIRAKQEVLLKNIKLLETYEQLALTSIEVGQASAVDVLRLQIRQNELQQKIDVLKEENKGIQAAMNSLLNRPFDEEITIFSTLIIPENDVTLNYERLSIHPELIQYEKIYNSVEQLELLNQKERKPVIGIGLEYINMKDSPMITSSYKDMLMPMFSLSVPIFNKKFSSQTKQNKLKLKEIEAQKKERLNSLQADLSKAIALRNQAKIKFDTQAKNLKQAKDAEEILIKNYETGSINFNDVLDIQELQLKFQMNQIESVQTYYVQQSIVNYFIQ
ncbi:TolC family protein [Mesonia ostreae]|uniref:TolC family protein n=1 Tax=Mesonia ostreae TaxID=861110 RepID=A0ABU2KEN1_9FLAO|nr:TolC family protein [Mesonia ostreae]MDT0293167.1 TolC family protein [Mesonia ostreae]